MGHLQGGLHEINSAVGVNSLKNLESSLQIIYCFGATTKVELNTFVTGPSVWCIQVSIMTSLWLEGQMNCGWSLAEERDLSLLQSKPGSGTYPVPYSPYTGSSSCSSKWPGTKLPTLLHNCQSLECMEHYTSNPLQTFMASKLTIFTYTSSMMYSNWWHYHLKSRS
jgi:hypothetical protein